MEAKRQLISLYLDKVLVYDDYVEVYLGALPLYIREKLIKKYRNPSKNAQIAEIFGRGETPQKKYAIIADDDMKLQDSGGYRFTEPTEYTTDDLMITIVVVGKGWLKNEMG